MVSRKKLNALILGVLLSSLFGYLEYGQGMSVFLFQAEKDALVQLVTNTKEAIHPFVLLPMLGQLLLILVLFQKKTKPLVYLFRNSRHGGFARIYLCCWVYSTAT